MLTRTTSNEIKQGESKVITRKKVELHRVEDGDEELEW